MPGPETVGDVPRGRPAVDPGSALGVTAAPIPASTRWRTLVRARLAEMDQLAPGRGADQPAFWDERAPRLAAHGLGPDPADPLVRRVVRAAGSHGSVLDVGAGAGRFAIPVAAEVGEVVAVDPSPGMLDMLRGQARQHGLTNVRCVPGRWEQVEVAPADVVVCSYVLQLVEDVVGFVGQLDAACRRQAFVYLSAASWDLALDPLWRHFHGEPRRPWPTYLDALAVLEDLGFEPEVEVVEAPVRTWFDDLGEAGDSFADRLLLPQAPDVRAELRTLLASWLVRDEGRLRAPFTTMPSAILSWRPTTHQPSRR